MIREPRRALFASAVALVVAATAFADGLADRLRDVERDLEGAMESGETIEEQETALLAELSALDKKADGTRQALESVSGRLEEARSSARRSEAERARVAEELDELRVRARARLAGLHRLALRGWGPLLLRLPEDLSKALRYRRYLERILDADRRTILAVAERESRVASLAAETKRKKSRLEAVEKEHRDTLREMISLRDERRQFLAAVRGEARRNEALVRELETASRRLRQELARSTRIPEIPDLPPPTGFAFPLGGRRSAARAVRNGIEIPAEEGSEILAVADGTVVFADWFPGYGRMVVVQHGDGLHSIYGYAESLLAGEGDSVESGQPIARVGRTGAAPEPSLYFEMRRGGEPEDPAQFVPRLEGRN